MSPIDSIAARNHLRHSGEAPGYVPRHSIRMTDHMIRAFSGRGSISLRDHTVTGLQSLQFTPIEHANWRFDLAFRELSTGCLIVDDIDELWELHARAGRGHHPLGLNFGTAPGPRRSTSDDPSRAVVPQECWIGDNSIIRTGTFHKRIDGTTISFALVTEVAASRESDAICVRVHLENRRSESLQLSVHPRQRVIDPSMVEYPQPNTAHSDDWRTISHPTRQWPFWKSDVAKSFTSSVETDLDIDETGDCWLIHVPPQSVREFALIIRLGDNSKAEPLEPGGASDRGRLNEECRRALDSGAVRWERWSSGFPALHTGNLRLGRLYEASLRTMLESTWSRPDWFIDPFYSAGTWAMTLAWDISFSSRVLSLGDADGIRQTLVALVHAGLGEHSYISWKGELGHHYVFTVFAGVRLVRDYLEVTGDRSILEEPVDSSTLQDALWHALESVAESCVSERGLVNFGDNAHAYLETRTDGYQFEVATASILFVHSVDWLTSLTGEKRCRVARGIVAEAAEKVWDPKQNWYANRASTGDQEHFWSYHLFEALSASYLTVERRRRLASHLHDGAFLGPHGVYSVSRHDRVHWDRDDADWGGGGQYTGMPLRIAQSLWELGDGASAWDVLRRCLTWVDAFPVIPQEISVDALATLDLEQGAEIAAGAGAQAIIFGLFGIQPLANGDLRVAPLRPDSEVLPARLERYVHRGHSISVELSSSTFVVEVAGSVRRSAFGTAIVLSADCTVVESEATGSNLAEDAPEMVSDE